MMMYLLGLWWIWLSIGIALAILELLLPGFIFLGFAIGAGVVAVMLLINVTGGPSVLLTSFAVASLIAWIGLKIVFKGPGDQRKLFDRDIND